MTVAADALLVTDRLREGLTKRNSNIFHRVVGVNFKIANCLDAQVDEPMARDLIKHVVEKGNAGVERFLTGTVEPDLHRDLGLCRLACHRRGSHSAMIQFAA